MLKKRKKVSDLSVYLCRGGSFFQVDLMSKKSLLGVKAIFVSSEVKTERKFWSKKATPSALRILCQT